MPPEPIGPRGAAGAALTAAPQARLDLGVVDVPPAFKPPEGWQALLDALQGAVWVVDALTLRVVAVNAAASALLDLPPRQLVGRPIRETFTAPEDLCFWDEAADGVATAIDSDTVMLRGGTLVPVTRQIRRLSWGATAWVVSVWDRSEAVRTQRELSLTAADLRATLESTHDGLLVTDLSGRIRNFNRRFATLWNLRHELLVRGDDDAVFEAMRRAVADPSAYMRRLAELDDPEAGPSEASDLVALQSGRILERVLRPQRACGHPIGRVASFRDVTEAVGAQQQVQMLAYADPLTGLPNRRLLGDRIAQSLAQSRREGSGFGLLSIDLDRFGALNQRLGRRVADDLLCEAARRIAGCLRQVDTIARLGSDEFAVLVQQTDAAGASMAATRVLAALARPCELPDRRSATLEASIGIVLCPIDGWDADVLLVRARAALDEVKAGGCGGVRFWHELALNGDR